MVILPTFLHCDVPQSLVVIILFLGKVFGFQDASFGKNARLVSTEVLIGLEVTSGWAIAEDVFHHLLFCYLGIPTAHDVGALDFSNGLALFVLAASLTLSHTGVWSTNLANQVSVLTEE